MSATGTSGKIHDKNAVSPSRQREKVEWIHVGNTLNTNAATGIGVQKFLQ